jgi:hypothetical protein
MNEKIRDIAESAGYFIDFDKNGTIVFKKTPGDRGDLELFAKLIIGECVGIVENEALQYAEPVWAVELVNDIKEHFGVE